MTAPARRKVLDRVAVVLVEPREAGNIGSVARAMANTGLSRLVLVRPAPHLVPDAFKMALAARPILERARVCGEVAEALGDFGFVAGTTRRGRSGRRARITPRALAAEIPAQAAQNEVAILFGREECGLTNDELKFCHRLVTIPSSDAFPSLNLAQAVMVMAHELFVAAGDGGTGAPPAAPQRAATGVLEGLYEHMERVLLEIGYLDAANPGRMMGTFRALLGRAGLDAREVTALRGVFRQVSWYARRPGGEGDG
jgi:TrmH family RNA methyltransferase